MLLISDEFRPDIDSTDDEETIAQEEAQDEGEKSEEIAALQRESQMDFDDFLSELPKDYLIHRDKIRLSESSESVSKHLIFFFLYLRSLIFNMMT